MTKFLSGNAPKENVDATEALSTYSRASLAREVGYTVMLSGWLGGRIRPIEESSGTSASTMTDTIAITDDLMTAFVVWHSKGLVARP